MPKELDSFRFFLQSWVIYYVLHRKKLIATFPLLKNAIF